MGAAERAVNVDALAQALLWTMVLPWIPCLLCYTLMHLTYKQDKQAYQVQLQLLDGGQFLRSSNEVATVEGRSKMRPLRESDFGNGTAHVDDPDEADVVADEERVGLLTTINPHDRVAGRPAPTLAATAGARMVESRPPTSMNFEPSESEVAARLLSDTEGAVADATEGGAAVVVAGGSTTSGASVRGRVKPRIHRQDP